jgi:hypothetical protein
VVVVLTPLLRLFLPLGLGDVDGGGWRFPCP